MLFIICAVPCGFIPGGTAPVNIAALVSSFQFRAGQFPGFAIPGGNSGLFVGDFVKTKAVIVKVGDLDLHLICVGLVVFPSHYTTDFAEVKGNFAI